MDVCLHNLTVKWCPLSRQGKKGSLSPAETSDSFKLVFCCQLKTDLRTRLWMETSNLRLLVSRFPFHTISLRDYFPLNLSAVLLVSKVTFLLFIRNSLSDSPSIDQPQLACLIYSLVVSPRKYHQDYIASLETCDLVNHPIRPFSVCDHSDEGNDSPVCLVVVPLSHNDCYDVIVTFSSPIVFLSQDNPDWPQHYLTTRRQSLPTSPPYQPTHRQNIHFISPQIKPLSQFSPRSRIESFLLSFW